MIESVEEIGYSFAIDEAAGVGDYRGSRQQVVGSMQVDWLYLLYLLNINAAIDDCDRFLEHEFFDKSGGGVGIGNDGVGGTQYEPAKREIVKFGDEAK